MTGLDIIATSDPVIVGEEMGSGLYKSVKYIEYSTDLQISPDVHYVKGFLKKYGYTLIYPRSSISKYNLLLCNSVAIIDHDFRGNIMIRMRYIFQPEDFTVFPYTNQIVGSVNQSKIYQKGDKICQIVGAWKENSEWELVNSLGETQRGAGGFGSTDLKR